MGCGCGLAGLGDPAFYERVITPEELCRRMNVAVSTDSARGAGSPLEVRRRLHAQAGGDPGRLMDMAFGPWFKMYETESPIFERPTEAFLFLTPSSLERVNAASEAVLGKLLDGKACAESALGGWLPWAVGGVAVVAVGWLVLRGR